MRVTYFALRATQVGDEIREPGDLIPEAAEWPFLSGYIQDGRIAPVLVATLPEEQQVMLLDWEDAMTEAVAEAEAPSPASDTADADTDKKKEQVA